MSDEGRSRELSVETSKQCQAAITERLSSMLGEEGVEILTEYIWHMITRPRTTKEYVCRELNEFLGDETENFVEWLIQSIGPVINEELTAAAAAQGSSPTPDGTAHSQMPSQMQPPPPPPAQRSQDPRGTLHGAQNLHVVPMPLPGVAKGKKLKKRCEAFPNCQFGEECRYIHPNEMCFNWPRCPYADECFYIHPEVPCRYGVNCPNWSCNYTHPSERNRDALQSKFNAYTGTFKNFTYVNNEALNETQMSDK